MGWGGFLDRLLDVLPIQGRIERIKNRLEKLESEREKLLKGEWSVKKAKRLSRIDLDIAKCHQLLRNRK